MRVLVLSPYLPHRDVGHGGGMAVRGLVRALARRHETFLLSLLRPGQEGLVAQTAELGAEVLPLPFLDRSARGAGSALLAARRAGAVLRSLRSGYPLYVEKYWSPRLSRQTAAAIARCRPDAIQVEYLQLSLLLRDLRRRRDAPPDGDRAAGGEAPPRPRLVLNTHELGSLPRRRRQAAARGPLARARWGREAAAWERLQRDATRWADTTLCVTEQDRRLLEAGGGAGCRTVPLGVDTEEVLPVWSGDAGSDLLFVGSFDHRPNRVSVKFLVDKVWPQVAQYLPEARLLLVGRGSAEFLGSLGGGPAGVSALGYVEDLVPLYSRCRLFVAPLVEGGGIKIKVLEAMARGIPVVTTPIGAEGIAEPEDEALVVAEPDRFSAAVLDCLRDEPGTRRRAAAARRIVEQRYSWSALVERLTRIYEGR